MAKEKGLTVIVDSRKSAPSELCLSALKLFKVSQCYNCFVIQLALYVDSKSVFVFFCVFVSACV